MSLAKYQAYELVQIEDRSILSIPAPGVTVYLAADVVRWLEERQDATEANGLHVCLDTLLDELRGQP